MTTAVMESVVSSNIKSIGYDETDETLFVRFTNGGLYMYDFVPQEIYEQFMESESKGKFFFKEIRNKFGHTNLVPTEQPAEEN